MIKVKHARTADCVVAGFRWHKDGKDERVGSLLLGSLRRQRGAAPRRRDVVVHDGETRELVEGARAAARACDGRASVARVGRGRTASEMTRMPGGQSRWSAGKDLSWEPLRVERVCEVKYDHMQGSRSAMPRSFCAGVPTSSRRTAATTSSRSRRLTSSRRSSARRSPRGQLDAAPDSSRRARPGRALPGRAQLHRHVLQVHADARPRVEPAAHGIDEHVSGRQMRRPRRDDAPSSARGPRARRPSAARGRSRSADASACAASRRLRRAPVRRAASGSAAATARRPDPSRSCRADSSSSALERTRMPVDARMPVADLGEARRHRGEREVARVADVDLVPGRAAPTRARRASGRTEYALAIVRSFAFWL